jgi:hypothetical protein
MQLNERLMLRATVICVLTLGLIGGIAMSRMALERQREPSPDPVLIPQLPVAPETRASPEELIKVPIRTPQVVPPKAPPKVASTARSGKTTHPKSSASLVAPAKKAARLPAASSNPKLKATSKVVPFEWTRRAGDPPWHEPPDLAPLFTSDGRSLGTWLNVSTTDAEFVRDSTLQDSVMKLTYGPWVVPPHRTFGPRTHLYHVLGATDGPVRSIYLRTQLKLSANWVQNPSNVLKIFELFTDEGESPIVGIYGLGTNIRLMVANDNGHDPNYAGAFVGQTGRGVKAVRRPPDIFSLDRWHTVEVVIVSNTPGVSDGILKTWLDGRPQTDVSDVMWTSAGFRSEFIQFDINALWGGLGGTLVSPQYLWIGKIYLAGSKDPIRGSIR